MAILYRTAKFKSANILAIVIWAQPPNLMSANISGYTVIAGSHLMHTGYVLHRALVLCGKGLYTCSLDYSHKLLAIDF